MKYITLLFSERISAMKFLLSSVFCFLSLSCLGIDNLALALRFYSGNPYLSNSEKSLFRQIDIAEKKYASNNIKLSLIYYLKGLAYERKNDINNAEINYMKSLKNNPSYVDAMLALMRIEKQLKKTDEYNKIRESAINVILQEIENIDQDSFFKNHILSDSHFRYAVENALIPSIYNENKIIMNIAKSNLKQCLKNALKQLNKKQESVEVYSGNGGL